MDCNNCEDIGWSGNRKVCGFLLHGGETINVKDGRISEPCPKTVQENNKWISVNDKLPLDHIDKKEWPGVIDEVLVTVELKFPDPNDDPEVMLLWFDNKTNHFSQEIGGKPYEENQSWKVAAWMPVPEPYQSKKERVVFVNIRQFIE